MHFTLAQLCGKGSFARVGQEEREGASVAATCRSPGRFLLYFGGFGLRGEDEQVVVV